MTTSSTQKKGKSTSKTGTTDVYVMCVIYNGAEMYTIRLGRQGAPPPDPF
jgi:hypothetical protein